MLPFTSITRFAAAAARVCRVGIWGYFPRRSADVASTFSPLFALKNSDAGDWVKLDRPESHLAGLLLIRSRLAHGQGTSAAYEPRGLSPLTFTAAQLREPPG